MVSFFVPGQPQTQGSKRGIVHPHTGRVMLLEQAGQKLKSWRAAITDAAIEAMAGRDPIQGAVELSVYFYFARPKSHFRTNGELKASAPARPAKRPDLDKLTRAVKDSMSRIVYRDDGQVVSLLAEKFYKPSPGVSVTVTETV